MPITKKFSKSFNSGIELNIFYDFGEGVFGNYSFVKLKSNENYSPFFVSFIFGSYFNEIILFPSELKNSSPILDDLHLKKKILSSSTSNWLEVKT